MLKMDDELFLTFSNWYEEAKSKELNNPNAMSLATVSRDGMPSVRIVLMKHFDEFGFNFFTNLSSQKGVELKNNPKASICFHWKSCDKQVRIQGKVTQVEKKVADDYFASRPKDSQIGAWASKQSQTLESREELNKRVIAVGAKYKNIEVPRPPFWSGFRILPSRVEFWHEYEFRLHDRKVFFLQNNRWVSSMLFP